MNIETKYQKEVIVYSRSENPNVNTLAALTTAATAGGQKRPKLAVQLLLAIRVFVLVWSRLSRRPAECEHTVTV